MGWLIAHRVTFTIDLNHQPESWAVKIRDVRPNWVLTSEFESVWPLSKLLPQNAFGKGRRASQLTRPQDGRVPINPI
jgi:hypothetical protein